MDTTRRCRTRGAALRLAALTAVILASPGLPINWGYPIIATHEQLALDLDELRSK